MARKARSLGHVKALSAWLYRTTRLAAMQAVRNECRRREREEKFAAMDHGPSEEIWAQIEPHLGEVMDQLSEPDRTALVLRFFESKSLKDVGHALGAALAVLPTSLRDFAGVDPLDSLRAAVILYAALYAVTAVLYLGLSSQAESPTAALRAEVSPQSRSILTKMSFLFALDSFAGGFQGSALFAYFFHAQFGASEAAIGMLFVGARIMNAFSHLGAAWLAARIGLVNTMVFTHTPSSLLTFTIPFTGSFEIAAVLFLLREGLSEMDVPTRQSYLMAVVRPEERTFAGGVTNLARMCARAIAPVFAGSAMQAFTLGAPIMAAAGLKILYDALLYVSFRKLKAPEER